ncbi:uncharacterized protein CXorf51A-like [Lepus europaeus]|uniref:uncharacterized protein CXorf51A-like n=1 Tax=Lepus europaeus TaxID=9983 RepID=UPI002B49C03D|nr:uncharacterized protein CXorf51A-like [Lepus europaeus]
MGKVVKKAQESGVNMEQPTSSTKQKVKTPYQSKSRGVGKGLKTTGKAKRPLQGTPNKKVREKTSTPVKKTKKTKGTTLFGHYHRLNEKLSKSDPKEEKKNVENSTVSSDGQGN